MTERAFVGGQLPFGEGWIVLYAEETKSRTFIKKKEAEEWVRKYNKKFMKNR